MAITKILKDNSQGQSNIQHQVLTVKEQTYTHKIAKQKHMKVIDNKKSEIQKTKKN